MSFMTWSSKTYTQVKMADTVLNLYFFLSILGEPNFKSSRLGFPSLETCWVTISSKNYVMSFMTWPSKTWTHMKTLKLIHLTSIVLSRSKFCNSMPPSLDNDCTIQDLASQVLTFGEIISTLDLCQELCFYHFMTWSSKTWTQMNMIVKTWHAQF